jgi:hypothetical protein
VRVFSLEGLQAMILKISVASALSTTLFLGIVIANAIDATPPPKKPAEPAGWVTMVFKNPR